MPRRISTPRADPSPTALDRGPDGRAKARGKRIDINLRCYVYVVDTEQLVQTTTLNVSRSGMLLKSAHPLAVSQDVLCLLSNKDKLNQHDVKAAKQVMKGSIVRVEREPFLFRIAVKITMGRVNPLDAFGLSDDMKSWWSRHWQ